MKSQILVTGGAGFIGSHLCEALLQRGHEVTCIDNFSTGKQSNIDRVPGLTVIDGDVNSPAPWRDLRSRHFAAVFHYAATVGVKRTEEDPLATLADAQGLLHLAAFARAGHADKIIFSSSSEVYGKPKELPEQEADGNCGWSAYTTVKLFGEQLLTSLWQKEGIPTVSLRFFNVYGPRQRGNAYGFVAAQFVEQALAGRPVTIHGDGQQTRDFVYIADNIAAAMAALDFPRANGHIINVGTGREITILQLAQAALAAAASSGGIEFVKARSSDIQRRCADTSRLQELLGVSCPTELAEGLARTVAWHRPRQVGYSSNFNRTSSTEIPATTDVSKKA